MSKGSARRPGTGFGEGYDRIFKKPLPTVPEYKLVCPKCGVDRTKEDCKKKFAEPCFMIGESYYDQARTG